MTSLLPPNATRLERAIERVSRRATDVPVPIATLIDPQRCPARMLPWLAWHFSVDNWDAEWAEQTKRDVIAASIDVHRRKGTIGSIRRALGAMGYGDAEIIEGDSGVLYGQPGYAYGDGEWLYQELGQHWAEYSVRLTTPVRRRQAELIRNVLTDIAPARSRLREVSVERVQFAYGDGLWVYGDDIAYGATYQLEV